MIEGDPRRYASSNARSMSRRAKKLPRAFANQRWREAAMRARPVSARLEAFFSDNVKTALKLGNVRGWRARGGARVGRCDTRRA